MDHEEASLALLAETLIRNLVTDDMDNESIRQTVLSTCIKCGIRDLVDQKKGCGVFSDNIWGEIAQFFAHQKAHPDLTQKFLAEPRFPRIDQEGEDTCNWPDCKIDTDLEKDHIIPRSCLPDSKKTDGKNWVLNGQWLCSFHNRVKTDGIIVGVLMLKS
mgnify:CR=1 FL=1